MSTQSTVCIVITIILYLAFMLYLGFRFTKANETVGDFYLGGRKLGPLVTAMSAEASDMSSWLLMGLPGVAYLSGICEAVWTAIGLGIGTYLNWLLVAKRLRTYTANVGAETIPDYFDRRFKDDSHLLLGISALIIVIFFIPYTASGFAACGKLFSSLFGFNYVAAMIVSAAIIVVYTASGGFLAASTTDLVQSIIMTIALVVIVCFGVTTAGGFDAVSAYSSTLPGFISLTHTFDSGANAAVSYGGFIPILSTLAWALGYFGMPHVLLRFMAIEDPGKIKLSRRIATIWVFIAMGVAIFIGVVGLTMVHENVIGAAEDPERIIIGISQFLAQFGIIPALLAGLVMAGILACTMSTCDSQLLAASSSISENIVHGVLGIKISDKMTMVIARVTLVVISVIAVFFALNPNSSVFRIVSFAWAGFGGAFGPVVLASLFWKRCNRWGALAGMVGGGAMVFIWKFLVRPLGGLFNIYELLPAFIFALILLIVVSLATEAPNAEILKEYDEAMTTAANIQ
jgi:sodium/proline symporter